MPRRFRVVPYRQDAIMLRLSALPALLLAASLSIVCLAEEKKPDPMPALTEVDGGPDFQAQGEYTGTLPSGDGELKIGVQIIALGEGNFHAVAYTGGLPGDGWNREAKIEVDGRREGDIVRFVGPDKGTGEIEGGVLRITNPDGQPVGELKRVVRQSPTLGKKPPEGAIVLFDGTSPDAFHGGRMTEDGLLMQGVTSKQTFDSFSLHLEFQLSFMPLARGQGRSNSGCYLQGRYEVQILDSFGLEGKHNECGGIYTIGDPTVNMCFPPLSWQTYDIDYTAATYGSDGKKTANARMTVLHNGEKVQDNIELPRGTTAHPTPEGPEPGPVYIQDHGNPLRFRNIWVVPRGN